MRKKVGKCFRLILHGLPYLLTVCLVIIWWQGGKRTEALLPYISRIAGGPVWAAVFLLCLYALKSQAFMLPFSVLYALSGLLFPPMLAISLNLTGVCLTVSIPYFQARRRPPGPALQRWTEAYPKFQDVFARLQEWQRLCQENDLFFAYFARVVGILPGALVSRAMGYLEVAYPAYLAGSLSGFLPRIVCVTMLGASIMDPRSPSFLVACAGTVALASCSAAIYWAYRRFKGRREYLREP